MSLLDTAFLQTFIRRDMLDNVLSEGAASVACEWTCAPRSWGGFGEPSPLQASVSVRLSIQLLRADEPTCSIHVWACVVPRSVMQHVVQLFRDSYKRFNNSVYRSLPVGRRTIGLLVS